MARFFPLFSGSSGNSYYIGHSEGGILIDAGVSARRLTAALIRAEVDPAKIQAIFVTHEHSDHIAGLRVFASRNRIRVFASHGTLMALEQMDVLTPQFDSFVIGQDGVETGGMRIVPFHTSHDSRESLGYIIQTSDGRNIAVATDLGYLSEEVIGAITGCDLVVLESNHDVRMLQIGPYPYYLKRRILSDTGHLSNDACASVLPRLLQSGATRFVLGHLSKENNYPELARQTALSSLTLSHAAEGSDYLLSVAPVENYGKVMVF